VAVIVQVKRKAWLVRFFLSRWGKLVLALTALCLIAGISTFTYYYAKYAKITDEKLRAGPLGNTSLLYSSPRPVAVGQEAEVSEIAAYLRHCGYSESNSNRMGWFHQRADAIEINPGPDAYDPEGAVIKIGGKKVVQIISLRDQTQRTEYRLEPELITSLFDQKREKRRIVHFSDIPKVMVNALLSAEDKHFFRHAGFDPIGILRAAWKDLRENKMQGASTITQQLARTLWLGPERGWRRKLPETMITLHLERKLTKEQIFEYYSNSIDLGHQGSFAIHGFGEASLVYFGKDLSQITLPEAALLAGLIQAPEGRNPFRYPDRAKARRGIILKAMRENGYITEKEMEEATNAPLKVTRENVESSDAPYFVDLVNETLQSQFADRDFRSSQYRVYTTLDMKLQRDAVAAVRAGIQETDRLWKKRNKKYGTEELPLAQVALVTIDATTGEVKALVGGRNYGVSQLDHAIAKRQPGSSFKPFVYTAAIASGLSSNGTVITPATTVIDEPTTFWFDDKPYEPSNHGNHYNGEVTLRYALAHSLNIPAVKVAEMVGYAKVAATARAAGLNIDIKATPSIALGAYEVTPLEIAGAYTIFPNMGALVKTGFLKSIRDDRGSNVYEAKLDRKQVIDARVAYVVTNMLEEVLRSGTGAGVRGKGFGLPAAGKTGTSRDGWFVGFTSKLICVVWVGFDDNRDFKLEGAHSALPIWAEFMKRAHQHREYKNVHGFEPPDGIVTAQVDQETGQLATGACSKIKSEVFLAGTQPVDVCRTHGGGRTQVAGWEPSLPPPAAAAPDGQPVVASAPRAHESKPVRSIPVTPQPVTPQTPAQQQKKGFFGRIRDLFK
jgi:penicillin-binding protein 1B